MEYNSAVLSLRGETDWFDICRGLRATKPPTTTTQGTVTAQRRAARKLPFKNKPESSLHFPLLPLEEVCDLKCVHHE